MTRFPFIFFFAAALIVTSCTFTSRKHTDAVEQTEDAATTRPLTEQERLDAEIDSILGALEAKERREAFLSDSLTRAAEAKAQEKKWYEKDFSIKLICYQYLPDGKRKQGHSEQTYTRIGNTVYLHEVVGNQIRDVIMEYFEGGGRKVRIYNNSALSESFEDDSPTPEKYIVYQFTGAEEGHRILADHPSVKKAEREEDLYGRPCAVVIRTAETPLINSSKTDIYWIDKEYGYIAKKLSYGIIAGKKTPEAIPFVVTFFTDQPSEKDIYHK